MMNFPFLLEIGSFLAGIGRFLNEDLFFTLVSNIFLRQFLKMLHSRNQKWANSLKSFTRSFLRYWKKSCAWHESGRLARLSATNRR